MEIPVKGAPPTVEDTSLEISQLDLSPESVLALYRHPLTRDAVIDYFTGLSGSEEIALTVLYYSEKFAISPMLTFSLMYTESRFRPEAKGTNPGSIDRGLFQLNSKSFPQLDADDFFQIDTNARHGMAHLKWCIDRAKGDVDKGLAIYNAGESRVVAGNTPESTKAYVRNINSYKSRISREFYQFMTDRIRKEISVKES